MTITPPEELVRSLAESCDAFEKVMGVDEDTGEPWSGLRARMGVDVAKAVLASPAIVSIARALGGMALYIAHEDEYEARSNLRLTLSPEAAAWCVALATAPTEKQP